MTKTIQHPTKSNLCVSFNVVNDPTVETIELNCSMFLIVIHDEKKVRFINFTRHEPRRKITKEIERIVYPLTSKGYILE